jgi:hypothetical protein
MSDKDKNDWVSVWTEVGRSWTKLGRAMSKVALESVADALKKTAQALDVPEDTAPKASDRRVADTDHQNPSSVKTPTKNG